MKILFVASEIAPFAKTGGLGDVAGALPKALADLGHDIRAVMPLYRAVNRQQFGLRSTDTRVRVRVGPQVFEGQLWRSMLPGSKVRVDFIEQPDFFDREEIYQAHGQDYPDNLARFSFFSQAALRMLPGLRWKPDVIHVHDWQAALASAHLLFGSVSRDPYYADIATVFTIHNLAYQGIFPRTQWHFTGLPESAFTIRGLEFYGRVNCLKGGLVSADLLTTVSPTYAEEIQTAEHGCGLEGILRERRDDLMGILNGIDLNEWNPAKDPHIPRRFHPKDLTGKVSCKRALQRLLRLPERHDMLIGMIQRLAEQKGMDIFIEALEVLVRLPVQIVILGTGDPAYQRQLELWARRYPDRIVAIVKFNNTVAHQIEAASDAFLMPSRFEPCGLSQMYGMRYGAVPIVRRVGGLADTVTDLTPQTLKQGTATGFTFERYSDQALVEAVRRALTAYRDKPLWRRLILNSMRRSFAWSRSAKVYVEGYERAIQTARFGRFG